MSQTLSSSTYTLLQFTVFLVLLQCYPDDDDKSDRYMLVIYNISQNKFHTCVFVGFFYISLNILSRMGMEHINQSTMSTFRATLYSPLHLLMSFIDKRILTLIIATYPQL